MNGKDVWRICKCYSWFPSPYGVSFILINNCNNWEEVEEYFSFRLLTEYHLFLFNYDITLIDKNTNKFPSPYGVSFILI